MLEWKFNQSKGLRLAPFTRSKQDEICTWRAGVDQQQEGEKRNGGYEGEEKEGYTSHIHHLNLAHWCKRDNLFVSL